MADLHADLNFASASGFLFPFVTRIDNGEHLQLKAHKVPIYDLRKEERHPDLDVEGFTWTSLPFDGLDGEEGWEERYAKETCEWLKGFAGAKACVPINTQIRRRTSEGQVSANYEETAEDVLGKQPVPAVHVDINRERASARVLTAFGPESGYSTSQRLAIINIWRPLKGPVMDAPLTVCDARTLEPADMDRTTDKYGGGYFIQFNTAMKWMYIRDQMPDEILIFRQYDSTLQPKTGDAACVAHTAFIDEERKDMGIPRQSIELRCALVY
ncbi:hypothetical protein CPB85DRAFT_1355983 [Mucidula mucida]|nr:hypothetical protein CPB85DRAFT_1355983 [Mucidula mucida]